MLLEIRDFMLNALRWKFSCLIIGSAKRSKLWVWLLARLRTKRVTRADIEWATQMTKRLSLDSGS